jgi:O-glycosyl hydrolase
VAPGAYHIASTDPSGGTLSSAAFTNVNGNRVTVVYNSGSSASTFNVSWNGTQSFSYSLPAGAIASFVWSPSSSVTPTPTGTTGVTPTATPTSTPVSTPTPTPTQTPGSSCRVHYAITSQWSGGFSVTLTVTNTGSTAINGWRLQFAFPNGQTITQLWNGSYTQSGSTITITNASYNASIPAGQSVSSAPGFNGTWNNSSNLPPSAFTLNGAACSVV